MKKLSIVMGCAMLGVVAWSQKMPPMPVVPPPPDPMKMNENPAFVNATGGMIEIKRDGSCFLFADARKEKGGLTSTVNQMKSFCRIMFEVKEVPSSVCSYAEAKKLLTKDVGAVAVIVDGDPDGPVLSAFPENRIAILNVTPLRKDATALQYESRLHKELWRALCFSAGGAVSGMDRCVMNTILDPADLDKLGCSMAGPVAVGGINQTAKRFGFGSKEVVAYISACKRGIAPKPANEAQQKIWDKVQKEKNEALKEPTSPIKIKYNPKKGR